LPSLPARIRELLGFFSPSGIEFVVSLFRELCAQPPDLAMVSTSFAWPEVVVRTDNNREYFFWPKISARRRATTPAAGITTHCRARRLPPAKQLATVA